MASDDRAMRKSFNHVVDVIIKALGSPSALVIAAMVIVLWAVTGPLFGFSDTWQLVINTSTTIVTFLMVFVIQNSQNRDAKAVHIKLDELIEAMEGARNRIALAETETEEQQDRDIEEMAKRARDEAIEQRAESRLEREAHTSN
jgi:low affinity Fe/Cu permease